MHGPMNIKLVVISYRRFGTTYRVTCSGFQNPILFFWILGPPQDWTDRLSRNSGKNVNKKVQLDATVCRNLFTAKSLYMFRVSQHPS